MADKLHNFLRRIQTNTQTLLAWRAAGFDQAILNLEKNYANIEKRGRVERDTLTGVTRQTILSLLHTPDVYAIVFSLSLISWVTGAFSEPGYDYGPWQPVVIGLAGILAGVIPLVNIVFLIPFHIILGINTWILTIVNIVASAVIFSAVEPVIPLYFYDGGIWYFGDLFWKILVFYAVSLLFIQSRIASKLSISHYQKRQNDRSLNSSIPADKRGDLIVLSAQDHYVKIITSNGSHLVRMSMKDAIALASDTDGTRVHRSHWVATKEMVLLEKRADRYFLSLRNGQQVPVSKSYAPAVQSLMKDR